MLGPPLRISLLLLGLPKLLHLLRVRFGRDSCRAQPDDTKESEQAVQPEAGRTLETIIIPEAENSIKQLSN